MWPSPGEMRVTSTPDHPSHLQDSSMAECPIDEVVSYHALKGVAFSVDSRSNPVKG